MYNFGNVIKKVRKYSQITKLTSHKKEGHLCRCLPTPALISQDRTIVNRTTVLDQGLPWAAKIKKFVLGLDPIRLPDLIRR